MTPRWPWRARARGGSRSTPIRSKRRGWRVPPKKRGRGRSGWRPSISRLWRGLARRLGEIAKREGGFDVVINNAAVYPSKPFEQYTIEEHQAVQRVNVDAGIVCVQAALPDMKRKGWGRIVNISSVTFYGGWALLSPYVASKAALGGLTRAWAPEFGPHCINVNAIAPAA